MKNFKLNNIKIWFSYTLLALVTGFCYSCNTDNPLSKEQQIEQKIDSLLLLMTLEEKSQMVRASSSFTSGGVERLGIPELVMSDGPHGVRHEHGRDWFADTTDEDKSTYLPTGITLASTWNRHLGYEFGAVLGSEAKARGKHVILGPGINVIRTPLNGRNFEYLGEDPYLISQMAIGYIKGVQDQGVAACVKHYIANNQEYNRNHVDVYMSERALREIYLPGFKASVEDAGVMSVMGAYNKFRGQYCTHNDYLVNDILKGEYNFKGVVISDWGATHDTREALVNGLDIEMGTELMDWDNKNYDNFFLGDSALQLIKSGGVDEAVLDDKVRRILRLMYNTNALGDKGEGSRNTNQHQALALKVAEEGIVLLKNEQMLPLEMRNLNSVAVIGHNAIREFAEGGGSSQVKPLYEITPLEGIKKVAGDNVQVKFAEGYRPNLENKANPSLEAEAIALAKSADAVIFVGGWIHNHRPVTWGENSYDAEARDKEDIKLKFGQEKLIQQLASANTNLCVVIMGGSNVEMINWMEKPKAILQAWYPGMEGGNAIANIIFGNVNPSGKLPVTFANSHLDYPSHILGEYPGVNDTVRYNEGIYVGYRYFDKENEIPLFPFGHGLSYTEFEYDGISANKKDKNLVVNFSVTNTGNYDGAEVAQVYVHSRDTKIDRPEKELKGFEKVYLKKGETKQLQIEIPLKNLRYYDESKGEWVFETGEYEIFSGSSSGDIRQRIIIKL